MGSGPIGKPCVCAQTGRASTVAAAAEALAVKNERRLTSEDVLSVFKVKRVNGGDYNIATHRVPMRFRLPA
jgi:hypothetical protein